MSGYEIVYHRCDNPGPFCDPYCGPRAKYPAPIVYKGIQRDPWGKSKHKRSSEGPISRAEVDSKASHLTSNVRTILSFHSKHFLTIITPSKSSKKIPPPEVSYNAGLEMPTANSTSPHNFNKTSEAQAKKQPTLTTPLLPKPSDKEKHKHKRGSNKNCAACQKDAEAAGVARAEDAAKAADQIAITLDFSNIRGGDSPDTIEHSKKSTLATKSRMLKNANLFTHSQSAGDDQKQQQYTIPVPEISEDVKKTTQAAKVQVLKKANLLRDFQRESAQDIQHGYDSVKKNGLAKSARAVMNATRLAGPRDQEHQALRQSECEDDDIIQYLEGQDCRHRNRNITM